MRKWDDKKNNLRFFMKNKIHLGQIICTILEKEGRKKVWLAKKMNYSLSGMCKILKRESMDSDMLMKISHALKHNFAQYLSDSYYADNEK